MGVSAPPPDSFCTEKQGPPSIVKVELVWVRRFPIANYRSHKLPQVATDRLSGSDSLDERSGVGAPHENAMALMCDQCARVDNRC